MPNLTLSGLHAQPLFDVASYARRGPGRRDQLTPAEIALIGRTVRRTPEVMVKVLTKDSNNLRSAARHLNYIGRYGELGLETDDGDHVQGRGAGQALLADWDLDLDADRRDASLSPARERAPKLVHKIMLSMPPGTPPKGVLAAARNFAREEFALKHRYVLVLHTDEPHPHVHLVVKVVSEQGVRLNISKATLRGWRREFARHLRDQGIAANATERAVRGEARTSKLDGIYRAAERGDSTHARGRTEAVAAELLKGGLRVELGKSKLIKTRNQVERGWRAACDLLLAQGHSELGMRVRRFLLQMPAARTEKEQLAAALLARRGNVAQEAMRAHFQESSAR
jgi:Relaxase/Mobilisation nuclease domain